MKKAILGGVLGGLALFVWGAISHMALPLGHVGMRAMPPELEPATLAAMKSAMTERAVYFFPGRDESRRPTEEEQKAWQAKYEAGPAGIVAFSPRPAGRFPTQLATELGTNILAALMAAIVMLQVPGTLGYGKRALLVGLLGLLASFDIDASLWNWYGFPTAYLLAQVVGNFVGWLAAGLVLARVCRE